MPPIRWLHLSDFHVGKDDYATRKMFDYILAHVCERKAEGVVPDLLFFTGDLANKGLASEYETFWLEFVSPLQDEIGGDIAERTFAIPGNHDADRSKLPAFSRDEIAKPESHYLDPSIDGGKLRGEMLLPRFQAYLDSDLTQVARAFTHSEGAYADCVKIHGQEVGIVGINTAWLTKDGNDERQLTPGKPLLEKALDTIKPAKLRIVLGHHPIDWFIPSQQKPIKSLLGQHHVLYLHGHLHDAWAEPSYGGGHQYLAIQAGAAFQAREGERWRNGLVWGEVNLNQGVVRLQPWRWTPDHQAWTPATDAFHEQHRQGDWWHYPLPGNQPVKVNYTPAQPVAPYPRGWSVFKPDDLAAHCRLLDAEAALRYFDGAVPDWSTALSASIPRRRIVGDLVNRFRQAESAGKSIISLLLAAGCEGKSTALLQAAYSIVEGKNNWRILQRRDESRPLVPDEILPLLDKDYFWLVLLDEADRAATDLQALIKRMHPALHGRVHALLACRDTDWLCSPAASLDWTIADFSKERLRGLDLADAMAIVESWHAFGDAGLGDLAEQPATERVTILERQAKDEAKTHGGAFFGALLAVRSGSDLRNHAYLLLERLGQRKIPSGGTLREALAYIAAMHAEGLEFLSRPVLAQALRCPADKLHRDVLVPLGQEAAATTTSSFIYTRHRRIAETLVSVLAEEFGEDVGSLYVALSEAAISARIEYGFVPDLGSWRYKISEHFLETGQEELAFNIAQAVLNREPMNALTRTHVSNLYRRSNLPEQAVQVFREASTLVEQERGYYHEWGLAESHNRPANSVLLLVFALADQCPAGQIDNDRARIVLVSLCVLLDVLYYAYHTPSFRDARMAATVLGRALRLDAEGNECFAKHSRESAEQGAAAPELEQAIPLLQAGIASAARLGLDTQILELLPQAETLTFDGLQELVCHSAYTKK